MRYLHDGSPTALKFLAGVGRALRDGMPEPADRQLWAALDGPARMVIHDVVDEPDRFWSRVVVLASAARSQFEALASATVSGLLLPGPIAAVSGTSPRFRGFRDRTWASCEGNLHVTVVMPLEGCKTAQAPVLTVLPAVAAREAIVTASGGTAVPTIKWVNDLFLGRGKVGGVLTRSHVQGNTMERAIVGIGVNLSCAPSIQQTPFVPATARVSGVEAGALLQALLPVLARRYRDVCASWTAPLLQDYRDALSVFGRHVRVYRDGFDDRLPPSAWPAPVSSGMVSDLRDDLSLVLDGAPVQLPSGRLAFEEDCRAFGLAPV